MTNLLLAVLVGLVALWAGLDSTELGLHNDHHGSGAGQHAARDRRRRGVRLPGCPARAAPAADDDHQGHRHLLGPVRALAHHATLTTAAGNGALDALLALPGGLLIVVLGNVLVTGFAGAVCCALRLRSGSLLAPALAHLATNDASYVVGWLTNH